MKHLTLRIRMLLIALAAVTAMQAEAITATIDNLVYELNTATHTATVTGGNPEIYDFVIPEKVIWNEVEFTVTEIGVQAFKDCAEIKNVTLPESLTIINSYAFYGCTGLTNITLPKKLTSIGSHAFYRCSNLTNITFPQNLITIENSAFAKCGSLTEITLPPNITKICESTFANCYGLTSITLPQNLTNINESAFSGCSGLSYIKFPQNLTNINERAFIGCTGLVHLTIHQNITFIGIWAFKGCSGLTDIFCYIDNPEQIQSFTGAPFDFNTCNNCALHVKPGTGDIYRNADVWKNFTNIVEDLGAGADAEVITTTIGDYWYELNTQTQTATITGSVNSSVTFYDIIIPEKVTYQDTEFTVTEIGDVAFGRTYAFRSITSLTIPETVTRIGDGAFADCTSLMHIICHTAAPIALNANVSYWSEESVPDCIVHVKPGTASAYRNADVWKGFGHIEENVDAVKINEIDNIVYFLNSEKRTASVMKRDYYYGGHIVIPNRVACDGIEYTVTEIEHGAFYWCNSVKGITLPEGLKKIGQFALWGIGSQPIYCYAEAPAEVYENSFDASNEYENVLHVKPGTGDAYRNADVWKNFTNIVEDLTFTTVVIDGGSYILSNESPKTATLISHQNKTGNVCIPDNVSYNGNEYTVVSIGEGAFRWCSGLTGITLPKDLTTICNGAFGNCSGLTSITLPENLTTIGDEAFVSCSGLIEIKMPQNLTTIGSAAFAYCTGLTNIIFPKGLTSIGEYAFNNCTGITDITLSQNLTTIGSNAFYLCTGLANIIFPEGLTTIGSYAFYGCTGLTNITLPQKLTTIERSAFTSCTGLTNIIFPEGLTTIGVYMFSDCTGLTNITLPESLNNIGHGAFAYCTGLTDIVVSPKNKHYSSIDGILFSADHSELVSFPAGKNKTEYAVPEQVVSIADNAFSGCTMLTEITLPNTITSIGEYAFSECTGLTDIILPQNMTSIENGTFGYCSGLTNITLPHNITSIGEYAFYYCTGLSKISLPENITSIGNSAFNYCTKLTDIMLPQSITAIEDYTFAGCSTLSHITLSKNIVSIGNYAFAGCKNLIDIMLPQNVSTIGNYAFIDCTALTDIYSHISKPQEVEFIEGSWKTGYWDTDTYANCTLHVKPGTGDDYRNTDVWKNFTNIVEDLETGIQNAKTGDKGDITLDDNDLTLGGAAWTISTIDGRAVAQGTNKETLRLPTGIYVVRCGNTVKKIHIR